ncbi:MAG: hypothetical protein V1685_06825 [Parcubacteria group bacterium]
MVGSRDEEFRAFYLHRGFSRAETQVILDSTENVHYLGKIFLESVLMSAKEKNIPFETISTALMRQSQTWNKRACVANQACGEGEEAFMRTLQEMCGELGIKFTEVFTKG